MSEAAAACAALAVGVTFDTRARLEAALTRLAAHFPSHNWNILKAVQNRRAVLLVRCHRDRNARDGCKLYFRATCRSEAGDSMWPLGNVAYRHAAHDPSAPVSAKRTRVDETVDEEVTDTDDDDHNRPLLDVGMVVLSSAADWSSWPSQIVFIAPTTLDASIARCSPTDLPPMPKASIAVRWFGEDDESWIEPEHVRPLTLEDALSPPARSATDYEPAEYSDLVKAYAEAASVLKRQAKAPRLPTPALEPPRIPSASVGPSPTPTPVPRPTPRPSPSSIRLDGSLEDLLVSIAPKMARALPTLVAAGVDDVQTLTRLTALELDEVLAVADLLPFDRIVLASRLRPHLVAS